MADGPVRCPTTPAVAYGLTRLGKAFCSTDTAGADPDRVVGAGGDTHAALPDVVQEAVIGPVR